MKTTHRQNTIALAVAFAIGGALHAVEHLSGAAAPWIIEAAQAQSHTEGAGGSSSGHNTGSTGGHDTGSTGGHDTGSTGGHDTGSTGGHDGGGGGGGSGGGSGMVPHRGNEALGHGTRYKHQGHASGTHGATSSHQAGADRFGGGSGLHGNNQIPEGIGRFGANSEQASDNLRIATRFRFRYWGGWTLPDDPTDPGGTDPGTTTLVTSTDTVAGPGGGPSINVRNVLDSSPRCEGVAPNMPAARQFGASNLRRLSAARGLVDPALAASGKIASPYLMANLQEELVKPEPNSQLAGTYLGLVAKIPVTPETVKKVGFQLCARTNDARAQEISAAAEQQRMAVVASADGK